MTDIDKTLEAIDDLPDAGIIAVYVGKDIEMTFLGTVVLTELAAEHRRLREEVEGYERMMRFLDSAMFFFPNRSAGRLGWRADISKEKGKYHYHLSGELPGEADTPLAAFQALEKEKAASGDVPEGEEGQSST